MSDQQIVAHLVALLKEVVADEGGRPQNAAKRVLESTRQPAVVHCLDSMIKSDGFEPAMRELTQHIIATYLWKLAISVDERRDRAGVQLSLLSSEVGATGAASSSTGCLHEYLVGALYDLGIDAI